MGKSNVRLPDAMIATLGCVIAISAISAVSWIYGGKQAIIIVAPSMGAAAVLLFAVPHAPMSQPWPLFVGNISGAFIGVCCQVWVSNIVLASGLAVGVTMAFMQTFRCVHPPGGASALAAVIGGDQLKNLGFDYVIFPVLLNCVVLFISAVAINCLFPWRRYPLVFRQYHPIDVTDKSGKILSKRDFLNVIHEQDEVSELNANLAYELYMLAEKRKQESIITQFEFEPGGVYGNNEPGAFWEIRKIVDYEQTPDKTNALIIYKILEGPRKNQIDSCAFSEFAAWSKIKFKAKA